VDGVDLVVDGVELVVDGVELVVDGVDDGASFLLNTANCQFVNCVTE
jgi:hypothetical protein